MNSFICKTAKQSSLFVFTLLDQSFYVKAKKIDREKERNL